MDKQHRIELPYIDVDEDMVKCSLANFVEAAGLENTMDYLKKDQTLTINEKVKNPMNLSLHVHSLTFLS